MSQKININTGQKQTFISLAILGILAIIAGSIYFVQFNFNPAVHPVASDLSAGNQNRTAPMVSVEKSLISFPPGQTPLSPLEIFDAASLSDKIDGKAELYLTAGFIRLYSQRFADRRVGDAWMEVFVYDMQTTQNAFSVFSAQRRDEAQTLDLGQYAYQTQNALFFVHGPFYVEILASDVSDKIIQPMRSFAETFIAQHPFETTQAMAEKQLFPKDGLIQESVALVSADAFGYDRFDHIFTAAYRLNDTELMAYISRRKTPEEAEELASAYQAFLTTFGGETAELDLPIASANMIHILDTYEIAFSHGRFLAGVREAPEKQPAQELAMRLFNRLKEADHASDVKE